MSANTSFQGTAQQHVDLSPLDFYLWGLLIILVYSAPIENEEQLHCIFYTCQTIHNCPSTFERAWQPMSRHVHVCIDSGGGHFEHLLWIVTW
jgi:hypothetical protein